MTQQINLYERSAEEKKGPLLLTLLGLAALAFLLVGYAHVLRVQNARLETEVKVTASQLVTEQAAIKTMKDALAQRMDPQRVAAELAALRSQASEAQEIVDRLKRGDLGTLDGFTNHLTALATVGEPGLWLTHIKITGAGRVIEVEGRSLQAESVLRYASEVNRQVSPLGASVTSLEMTPIVNERKAQAVAFKLF